MTFPQLNSGAIAQYPTEAMLRYRTVVNESADGRRIKWSDIDNAEIVWDCEFEDLNSDEWIAVKDLFDAMEGRLGTFAFFNPFENLLNWSEDFTHSVWVKDPLLTFSGGISDPFGGTAATHLSNGSGADQSMLQLVSVQSTYQTCFSVWVGGSSGQVKLARISGGLVETQELPPISAWTRVNFSGVSGLSTSTTKFGVQMAPGAQCDLFGAQLDLQLAPSSYKKSAGRSGVYLSARFDDDRLIATALGPGRTGAKVRVRARLGA